MTRRHHARWPLAAALLVLLSCSDHDGGLLEPRASAQAAAAVAAYTGNNQWGLGGALLPKRPVLEVKQDGVPVVGARGTIVVSSGGGSVSDATFRTNAQGRYAFDWTLGASGLQTVTVTLNGGNSAVFSATAIPVGSTFTILSGNNLSAPPGDSLPAQTIFELKDPNGVPIAGAPVTFALDSLVGGGLRFTARTTSSTGRAANKWLLGWGARTQYLTARIGNIFSAQAVATVNTTGWTFEVYRGDNQVAAPGDTTRVRPQIVLKRQNGTPVIGAPGTFAAVGGGSVSKAPFTTNKQGRAGVRWRLGTTGAQQLVATIPVMPAPVTFNATFPDDGPITLVNGVARTVAGAQGTQTFYRLYVPAGSTVTFSMSGGSGDADMYVRGGELPTFETFDCRPWLNGNNETCTGFAPSAGYWYIMLDGYLAYADVSLTGSYTQGGTLNITSSGLPAGSSGSVSITGPNNYNSTVNIPLSVVLPPGTYTVESHLALIGGNFWVPTPSTQQAVLTAGNTTSVGVTFAIGSVNLDIGGLYITQSTQKIDRSVPLVANRPGLLRVFARSSSSGGTAPSMRVRVYHSGLLVHTAIATSPGTGIPLAVNEALRTYEFSLTGAQIQPSMTVLADIDYLNTITETDESDNAYPLSGTPQAFDVRTLAPFQARMVPVVQPSGTGDVNSGNVASYVAYTQALYPIPGSIDVDVRAPYSYYQNVSSNYDLSWNILLQEIDALRVAEGTARYYYGVLRPNYTAGGTGMGYLGTPASIGIDTRFPDHYAQTVAHEFGHNFNRRHAPCGSPANPDANFPYADARTGQYGWDVRTNAVLPPTLADLMSYCDPEWISDYTYKAVLEWRDAESGMIAAREPSLLVWGRVTSAGLVLEPAFEVTTRPVVPEGRGSYMLEVTATDGTPIYARGFEPSEIDHLPNSGTFAFALPLRALRGREIGSIRVSGRGLEAVRRKATLDFAPGAGAADMQLARTGGAVRLQWDETTAAGVMVRDARTGDILTFARGGIAHVRTNAQELDLVLSDGVRSTTRRVTTPR